jgi:hypothetical protein
MGGEAAAGGDADDGGMAGAPSGGTGSSRCEAPRPWSSNLEQCAGYFVHRPVASKCSVPVPDSELEGLAGNAGVEDLEQCNADYVDGCFLDRDDCTRDGDCAAGGFCIHESFVSYDYSHRIIHRCALPCRTDSDCLATELCACDTVKRNATRQAEPFGVCIPATCRVDGDCGNDRLCIAPLNPRAQWHVGTELAPFHCQTENDECDGPSPCPEVDPQHDNGCCQKPACIYADDRFECAIEDTCDPC